ncbi:MAG: hypothetical protein KDK39_15295, partial [Leptospiraceae bacterium]|nr:hypothetical protein [Leptospiraceae bacterium]
ENSWAFVRQSATWANANTDLIEAIVTPIKNSGALNYKGTYTRTVTTAKGITFTARLTVGTAADAVTAQAFSGNKYFDNKFEMWRASDNAKALELFFDSLTDLSGDGILLIYNLNVLDPYTYSDSMVVESYSFKNVSSRVQVYSWSSAYSGGKSGASYVNTDRGRVILDTMENDTVLCFKAVVRFDGTNNFCTGAAGNEYYALSYSQFFASPNYATARMSLQDGAIDNSTSTATNNLCNGTGNLGNLKFGLFDGNGFVSDGNEAAAIPANYLAGTRVNSLHAELGTVGPDGSWDDTTKATIDALNVQFKSTAAP